MIIVVGGIVGFIVIAMYLPMFKVYDRSSSALVLPRLEPPSALNAPGGLPCCALFSGSACSSRSSRSLHTSATSPWPR